MASLHQPTEVFRFLHVRNPRIVPTTADPTVFLKYTLPSGADNLYADLIEIKNAGEKDWKEQIVAAVNTFKSTDEAYKNIFQVNLVFRDFFEITEFLINNDLPGGVTLKDWLINEYGIDPASFFTPEVGQLIDKFWNNIFAQAIVPDNNGVLSQLILNLRIINLIELARINHESTTTIEGIRADLKALGLLPEDLFPINILPAEDEENGEPGNGNEEEIELYNKIIKGIEELNSWYENMIRVLSEAIPNIVFLFNETDPPPSELQAYLDAIDEFNAQVIELNKYKVEYADEIGINFKDAVIEIGHSSFVDKSKEEVITILVSNGNSLFETITKNSKEGYDVVTIGKTILEETSTSCSECCNEVPGLERFRVGPIGMGDFYKVEQMIHCYKPAEIAHVENVMIGETRNRETRRLDRFEETIVTEVETITETEKDFQTTSRSEQEVNSETVTETNQSLSAGLNLSGSYGTVHFNSSFNTLSGGSSSSSLENASKYSREIVERARQLEIKRMRSERTIKILHEYEETNTHGFTNTTEINQVGVYRWLDKFYYNRLINYGPHLMFEFIIPEPAFFHLYAKRNKNAPKTGTKLIKPLRPDDPALGIPLTSFSVIDRNNYTFWSAYYNTNLAEPPASEVTLSIAFNGSPGAGNVITGSNNSATVPQGYEAYDLGGNISKWGADPVVVLVGGSGSLVSPAGGWSVFVNPTMSNEEGTIGITYLAKDHHLIEVRIRCRLKTDAYNAWKANVYENIWKAYYDKQQKYEDDLNALQQQLAFSQSFSSTNPAFNRDTEKMELKKHSLEMLMEPRFKDFTAAVNCPTEDKCSQPEINKTYAYLNGKIIKFFETAFEWDQITYEFYQYFWGRKCKWKTLYNLEDNSDPLFQKFLQAGAARVVVPVRRGREASIMYYVETGTLLEDASIVLTLSEHVSANSEMIQTYLPTVVDTWITKMPTNLVALHCVSGCIGEDGTTTGLPCYPTDDLDDEPPVYG